MVHLWYGSPMMSIQPGMDGAGPRAGQGAAGAAGCRIASAVAVAFGLLTLREGAAVLFGGEAARRAAGHYVPFVLWFNFLAGFLYVAAGVGLWLRRRWAVWLSLAIVSGSVAVFAALGMHVLLGGAYEERTVAAMGLRTLVWTVILGYAVRRIPGGP